MTTTNTAAASLSDDPMCRHCYNRKSAHTAKYESCPEEGMGNYSFSAIVDVTPTQQAGATIADWRNLYEIVYGHECSFESFMATVDELSREASIAAGGAQETAAARDALAERQRQVAVEGFAPEQDDRYQDGSLAGAAICYALTVFGAEETPNYYWPRTWSASWWKPTTPRRNLVKAAALILAEIERIDRAAPGTCFFCSEPMNSAHESDCPQAPTAASNGAPK